MRSDSGKWGQVPAKFLKMINGSTEGEVTVHTPIESPDIVVRSVCLSVSHIVSLSLRQVCLFVSLLIYQV